MAFVCPCRWNPCVCVLCPCASQAFYELDLNSWDVAAGALLVTEAGGRVTNSDGTSFSLATRNVVASNGQGDVHSHMIELIDKADAVQVRA